MPERHQQATGSQRLGGLGRSGGRVDPVPGRAGDDRVELPPGGVPGFEGRHLDLEPAAPGELGHPRVGLDPEHRAAGRLELPGFGAGAAADVEDVVPRAGGDDPLDQGVGVAGPGPVVAFEVHPERLRHLPVAVRLALGGTWLLVRHGGHLLTLGSAGGVGL